MAPTLRSYTTGCRSCRRHHQTGNSHQATKPPEEAAAAATAKTAQPHATRPPGEAVPQGILHSGRLWTCFPADTTGSTLRAGRSWDASWLGFSSPNSAMKRAFCFRNPRQFSASKPVLMSSRQLQDGCSVDGWLSLYALPDFEPTRPLEPGSSLGACKHAHEPLLTSPTQACSTLLPASPSTLRLN